ncbi:hypothetical protein [Streptomyces sp. NPDC058595]|uniref:hypothetical protein n=1 Tax=Streptomyces sp. NPDC058595 TaxID=3346550 RepID=UPI003654F272
MSGTTTGSTPSPSPTAASARVPGSSLKRLTDELTALRPRMEEVSRAVHARPESPASR